MFPAYRGSDEYKGFVLPFPYVVYRGEFLRADREGVRALFVDTDRVTVDLSGNGSVPADSDDVELRRGMPDLDSTFEIGPSVNVELWRPLPTRKLSLKLPVRAVFSTDLRSLDHRGYTFFPHLNFNVADGPAGFSVGANIGPLFATRKYHEYYYEVAPQFATATRPAYSAGAGYSGAVALFSARRRFGKFWLGAFVRYDYLNGADFDDSPLVETDHAVSAGIGLAYVFAQSEKRVASRD